MLAEDALHNVELLLCEIKAMILRGSTTASQAIMALGVSREFCRVAHPRCSTAFDDFKFIGNTDGLTLGHIDQMVQTQSFNIFGTLTNPNSRELDNAILMNVATLILRT